MHYKFLTLFAILTISISVHAQEKWSLLKCLEYAMANNIAVKQIDLQSKTAALQYKQSKLGQFPSLSFSGSTSYSSGRNQDPTSFSLITQSYLSTNMQLQTSAEIFNWFSKRNAIEANQWELKAAKANTDKLKNDIALSVANAYLQILLAIEQGKIAGIQLQQSQAQLSNTRKIVDAGALPELNAAELEAQVARDSSIIISARGNIAQSVLNLKSLMAIDAADSFQIETPPVEKIPIEKITDLQPDAVYTLAMVNMPQQKVNDFKIKAAQKTSAVAKGNLYPAISVFGNLGSGFNSRAQSIVGSTLINAPFGSVKVNGIDYNVFPLQPFTNYTYGKTAFLPQLNKNLRQSVGLGISVPIFSGYNMQTNYQRTKITIISQQLQKAADNQKLKQDIYQAYNAALIALEKFNAGKKSLGIFERTFDFAQKRYEVGMLSTFELITNQNNLFRARLENVLNQFDYVFKMKVLEFYKGQGLKL